MPVKQWLEERRFLQARNRFPFPFNALFSFKAPRFMFLTKVPSYLQGEMQHLRDKLTIAERTAKSEAQLKVR